MSRVLAFLLPALIAACAAPMASPHVEVAQPRDLKTEIREAARVRDLARLKSIQPVPPDNLKLGAELARALYWTAGVAAAKSKLSAACNDNRMPADSPERARACAVLAFDDLAAGKPMNHVKTGGQGAFLDKQKLLIAMIAVNGNPAEPFIVDTGAPTTIISRRGTPTG